jgi:hypothetical protein
VGCPNRSHNQRGSSFGFGRAGPGPGGRWRDFRGRFLFLGHNVIIVGQIISGCKPFPPIDAVIFPAYSNGMARPKAEKTKSAALRIRLFPEQEDMIRQAATKAGVSISAWMGDRLTRAARRELKKSGGEV